MKRLFVSLTVIVFAVCLTGAYSSADYSFGNLGKVNADNTSYSTPPENIEKEFTVKEGQLLKVELESGGEIEVEGWNKNVVKINVIIRGRDAEDVEMEFDQNAKGVDVYADYLGRRNHRSCDIKMEIKVPAIFDLELQTNGGEINLDGIEGNIESKTMGGALTLINLKGKLACTTMGGSIDISDCEADGKVKTMGGSVSLENIMGDIDASTMGGSITQRNVKGNKGTNGKALDLSTMGGSIKVDDAPNGAELKTMGGSIRVKSAGKFLKAETMGGNIEANAVDGEIKAKTMGGDIEAVMVGNPKDGNRDVTLTSMGGDIELTVPDGLDMDIDIEIAFTRRYENKVEIISDFDIEEEVSDDWEYDHGKKRKTLFGSGKTGSGKNRIKIRTVNGIVTIKKG